MAVQRVLVQVRLRELVGVGLVEVQLVQVEQVRVVQVVPTVATSFGRADVFLSGASRKAVVCRRLRCGSPAGSC